MKSNKRFPVEPERFVDEIAERVSNILGNTFPFKRVRNSQILSAIVGAVGFSLFTLGIDRLFSEFSPIALIVAGFLLMLVSGLLLKNLWR